MSMLKIDLLIKGIIEKKNPSCIGIDPDWEKIPNCYKRGGRPKAQAVEEWAFDIIDAVSDIVAVVKPQMAFYEILGYEGLRVFENIVKYAHSKGLIVVDDSKRNDIGNTAKAYAFAHIANNGPINADFLTVSPFLGTDSLIPFIDIASQDNKGLFILVKTSNPSSGEISNAIQSNKQTIMEWLANYVALKGNNLTGTYGYSSIGAVVGATFPEEAKILRKLMPNNMFLVPGYGSQGATAMDIVNCFNKDGLGAIISSSRGILYKYLDINPNCNKEEYLEIIKTQSILMRDEIRYYLKKSYSNSDCIINDSE